MAQDCQEAPPQERGVPQERCDQSSPGQVGAWHPHKVMHSRMHQVDGHEPEEGSRQTPQTWRPKEQKFIFSWSWRLET